MLFLTELNDDNVSYIAESTDGSGKKRLYLEGTYLQSCIKNKNGRMYPEETMDNEVGRYLKESVEMGSGWGELSHPATPILNPDRISHRIVEMRKDGKNWIGKSIVADTACGNTVRGLYETGGRIGVSSRAIGSLVKRGDLMEVQNDFRLATAADVVLNPSAPLAFVNGLMENVSWFYDESNGWKMQEIAEDIKNEVHRDYKSIDEAAMLKMFNKFLGSI